LIVGLGFGGSLKFKGIIAVEGDITVTACAVSKTGLKDDRSLDRILLTPLRHVNHRRAHFLLQRIQIGAVGRFISNISAV
jgi:hypothetical protein